MFPDPAAAAASISIAFALKSKVFVPTAASTVQWKVEPGYCSDIVNNILIRYTDLITT